MPKRRRNFSRQRASSKNLQRNILIGVAVVIGIIAVVAIIASQSGTRFDVSFPARESGNPNAKVIVEEYSDYQCPYCGLFATTAEIQLREEYIKPGKILFIFRNFPIADGYVANGYESHLAALATLCAGDQNMFWEYHDYLYQHQDGENQGYLNISRLEAFAVELHLDSLKFNQCLSDQTHQDVLTADINRARALGVDGTPTFFVNGSMVNASPPNYQELFDAIDRALLTTGG
jgi:protein-disulfide isomerase